MAAMMKRSAWLQTIHALLVAALITGVAGLHHIKLSQAPKSPLPTGTQLGVH